MAVSYTHLDVYKRQEQDRVKIEKLSLNLKSWMALIREAINLIVGDQEAGE